MRIVYAFSMVVVYSIGVFLGSLTFATQTPPGPGGGENGAFIGGFGPSDSDNEDDYQVHIKDIKVGGATEDQEEQFVDVIIKSFTNWTLGILGLIALIMFLYGGFLMLTARDNEESYNKGRKVLKNALIGLAIIGTSWFIISIIFRLIFTSTDVAGPAGTLD